MTPRSAIAPGANHSQIVGVSVQVTMVDRLGDGNAFAGERDGEIVVERAALVPHATEPGLAESRSHIRAVALELDCCAGIDRGGAPLEHPFRGTEEPTTGLRVAAGGGDTPDVGDAVGQEVRAIRLERNAKRLRAELSRAIEPACACLEASEIRELACRPAHVPEPAIEREALLEQLARPVIRPFDVCRVGDQV